MDSQDIELAKPINPFYKVPLICASSLDWCPVIYPPCHNFRPYVGGKGEREDVKLHVIQRPMSCLPLADYPNQSYLLCNGVSTLEISILCR